ncbi:manganese/iron transport system ATP-binding protein [Arcanobacterium pluranimalium]|uniref:anchored repeat-type ABC transporter ATP-binding subunit n=1 Tax=Arcanobacterium pluranimalium TaxID=108028 RepID=UPI00195EA794|nr:manganese/iron transport system ATP-binding protein [Arcanobacterium pluranimalium]
MKPVVHIDGLNVSLGGRHVLRDINLDVYPGELLGLIGPNGAGKTTLMRSIMGLIPLDSGKIESEESSAKIGYVPQRQDIDWTYPISIESMVMTSYLGELGIFRRPRKEHWAGVYAALRKVGLYELRSRTIAELSGGQKQRVLIARALATNPVMLLLDEPFSGLDHPNQDALSDLFVELARNGVSIVMSTHDLSQAVDISDRLAMINRTLRAIGKPQDLLIPDLWMETYQVRADSALLRSLGMGVR